MNKIEFNRPECFDLEDILESGQVFRYEKINDGFFVYSKDKRILIREDKEKIFFEGEEKNFDYFFNYFNLDENVKADFDKLKQAGFPSDVLEISKGVRILAQDIEETIYTFIISQNNNIKRIKNIVSELCIKYGKKVKDCFGEFYSFPTSYELSNATVEELRNIGLGYRDKYIFETSKILSNRPELIEEIKTKNTEDARKLLITLPGIGPKVADCILLFAFSKRDVFPLDTWMEKVFKERFSDKEKNRIKMAQKASIEYGNLAGYAQQLYFFHIRKKN